MIKDIADANEDEFNRTICRLKNSTSIEKNFKKVNPSLVTSWTAALPRRLLPTLHYLFTEITRNIFYQKGVSPDIWSRDTIDPYDIMRMCSGKFSSKSSSRHYRKILKELVDLHLVYEYKYPYSQKYGAYIRLFSIEHEIYQWEVWDSNTPILPTTIRRVIKSYPEVLRKSTAIIRNIDRNFDGRGIADHFAQNIYDNYVQKMSPEISSEISSYATLKKKMTAENYLKYVLDVVSQFGDFYGLDRNIKTKISEKSEKLMELLFDSKYKKFDFQKLIECKKTPVVQDSGNLFAINFGGSNGCKHTLCSMIKTNTKQFVCNDLQKVAAGSTDNLLFKENSFNDNSFHNINNKEYNGNVNKKKNKANKSTSREGFVSNSHKRSSKKMENMCVKDIIPENESFRKPKRNRKANGEKQYRNHKDGWFYNGLTGKIFGGPRDFTSFFRKTILKHHKGAEFSSYNGAYQREMNSANYTMDDLVKRDCNNDAVITEWVEWYAQVFLKNKKLNSQRFLTIEYLRKTWDEFDDVRRKDVLIVSPEKKNVVNENSMLSRMSKIFNGDCNHENTLKALKFFGVIVVANYLQEKFRECCVAEDKIDSVFEKIKQISGPAPIVVSIFNSTCRFLCDFTNTRNKLLTNWVEKYGDIWAAAGCNFNYYKKNDILIESEKDAAEDFFKELYANVESK